MTVADYILKFLISKNVSNVFLIIGGAISFVVDAFSRNKKITYKEKETNFLFIHKLKHLKIIKKFK
jgi:NDP-sugar pyrophosphorylase family protein